MSEEKMARLEGSVTRRDFLRGAACAGLAATVGIPLRMSWADEEVALTRVVLMRHEEALDASGNPNSEIIKVMLDQAISALLDEEKPDDAWKRLVNPDDIVGIKSNEWGPLPTPWEVEDVIQTAIIDAGVKPENISIGDRGVRFDPVFRKATALINVRPLRTHHWSGVGGLLKNYIMFVPEPSDYHDNSCADLAAIWKLPAVKDKTRLNILLLLRPQFHGIGPHHYDEAYVWEYKGLLVGTDPVAVDAVGLQIFEAKRRAHFGEKKPLKPPAHHIAYADIRHKLGTSDLGKIQLLKLGWQEDILI
jgi:hypothetical protein